MSSSTMSVPMKALVYVDGSDASLMAVERALQLAAEGAEAVALHVYPPRLDRGLVSHFEIETEDLDAAFAGFVLRQVAERFEAHGLSAGTLVMEGRLTEVICDQAAAGGFDLILVGSLDKPRLGAGLAEAVRRLASVPVEAIF